MKQSGIGSFLLPGIHLLPPQKPIALVVSIAGEGTWAVRGDGSASGEKKGGWDGSEA